MHFPQGGQFSQHVDVMKEGDCLDVIAVAGDIYYLGNQQFMVRNRDTNLLEPRRYRKIGMIAAGAGITPMF